MDNRVRLRLATQVGLLTNVTGAMRAICVSLVDNEVRLLAYFDRVPTEDERDMLVDAAVETAGDFPDNLGADVECIVDLRPMRELMGALREANQGYLVYARHEDGYG